MYHKSNQMNANNFDSLVGRIQSANEMLQDNACLVINRHVTAKAWLTGYYIVEYEQNGEDRAKYGDRLLKCLSERLGKGKFGITTLKIYRQFYFTYPQIVGEIANFIKLIISNGQSLTAQSIRQSLAAQLQITENVQFAIGQSVTDQLVKAKNTNVSFLVKPYLLFNKLSFTHLANILTIKDPLERAFYETMAIRGTWSVRELQRQIDSNYYVRSGWSGKPEALANLVDGKAEKETLAMDVKSPFVFEFLGLPAKDVIEESDLEQALMDNLQQFIQELGMGFCFEERQKKMLIDDRYYFADLVFYHRILKRHVIIELKAHRLDYTDSAQLKMYLNYYRKNIMQPDDNPPVGILMCSEVGQEMAEYTLLDQTEDVFVSKYELSIPSKKRMMEFLRKENEGL